MRMLRSIVGRPLALTYRNVRAQAESFCGITARRLERSRGRAAVLLYHRCGDATHRIPRVGIHQDMTATRSMLMSRLASFVDEVAP